MYYPSATLGDLQYQRQYEFDGNFILYEGVAAPGTEVEDAGWIIIKYTNDGTNTTASRFADASISFNKIWAQRTVYAYAF